jgi:SAM-dependent methyltransferase
MTDACTVSNPFFARLWSKMSTREPESIRRLRRENLAGLTGRVLEVGAGTGTNFEFYPTSVSEVVAVEPEQRLAVLAREAAEKAPIPVTVSVDTAERYAVSVTGEPFDAVVCSLVLCSVDDPDTVLRQLFSTLREGGELRYLEHVASAGPRAGIQRLADATVWPRLLGNCHTHRHTERSIADAGFEVGEARREWVLPAWVPLPVSETAIGRAVKPA